MPGYPLRHSRPYHRFQRVALEQLQQGFQLLRGVGRSALVFVLGGQFCHDGGVKGNLPHADSVAQAPVDVGVVLPYSVGGQARLQLLIVAALKEGRGQVLELDAVERLVLGDVVIEHIQVLRHCVPFDLERYYIVQANPA